MDFTLKLYNHLLNIIIDQGFKFSRFDDFISDPIAKVVVLRHDVDALPQNSLKFARIQATKGIKGTYYFRINPKSFNEKIIKEIASLGHEIGYHYEDVSLTAKRLKAESRERQKENYKGVYTKSYSAESESSIGSRKFDENEYERYVAGISIKRFQINLDKLRTIVPVRTICMHGSPMSRWDSKLLWKYFDYKDFGIIGEPYLDVNYEEVLYLTDTGRRWDGDLFSIRDKVKSLGMKAEGIGSRVQSLSIPINSTPNTTLTPCSSFHIHSTLDIIKAAEKGLLPDKIIMTFHPQRWTDKLVPWVKELIWQNVKNVGKYFLIRISQ